MIPPPLTDRFLADAGWVGARVTPLAGDASFRRYFRISLGERRAVLMDAPPPHEDPRPFIVMADYLAGIGLSAPRILHRDMGAGLLLIDDLGDTRMRETVDADPECEAAIYRGVVDVLIELHRHAPPAGLRRHDLANWREELDLFIDWYGPTVGLTLDGASFHASWAEVLGPLEHDGAPWVTELRDYHAENVMLIDGGAGTARFGLLDFQDARIGHPAYDLVSMLEDARRDVTPATEAAMLDYYVTVTGRDARFARAYWALGAQRNTRILGVFCRLWKRDGKAHYTSFQPRMWGLLERDLAQPGLAPVRAWFDQHVPPDKRAAFWRGVTL
ncbi:MAG: phosphotransferase [Sphingopyxis sp.]